MSEQSTEDGFNPEHNDLSDYAGLNVGGSFIVYHEDNGSTYVKSSVSVDINEWQ